MKVNILQRFGAPPALDTVLVGTVCYALLPVVAVYATRRLTDSRAWSIITGAGTLVGMAWLTQEKREAPPKPQPEKEKTFAEIQNEFRDASQNFFGKETLDAPDYAAKMARVLASVQAFRIATAKVEMPAEKRKGAHIWANTVERLAKEVIKRNQEAVALIAKITRDANNLPTETDPAKQQEKLDRVKAAYKNAAVDLKEKLKEIATFLQSFEQSLKDQKGQEERARWKAEEAKNLAELHKIFDIIRIKDNGDCLFEAARAASATQQSLADIARIFALEYSQRAKSDAEFQERVKAQWIAMFNDTSGLTTRLSKKLTPMSSDERVAWAKEHGPAAYAQAFDDVAKSKGKEHFWGGELELQALPNILDANIQLFELSDMKRDKDGNIIPNKVFEARNSKKTISLLFTRSRSHYDALKIK